MGGNSNPGDEAIRKVSLKSCYDKYLGVDKFGAVECSREAVGPTEEWEVIHRPDGFCFKSVLYNKFLKLDLNDNSSSTTITARADSDTIGFLETVRVKCQLQQKHKLSKDKMERELAADELEREQL